MRPSRNNKNLGRHNYQRTKQPSCPQYLRSTWPNIHSDNEDMAFLATMRFKGVPLSYSSDHIKMSSRKYPRKTSTPVFRYGDTDTEDEGFPQGRFASISSQGSTDIRRQAASMGSLTSSYSSLGERSNSTLSPLEDFGIKHSVSLRGILDPDLSDYDHDPKMREAVEDIVSPKPVRTRKEGLAAVDPSILVALPTKTPEAHKYSPTALCDLTVILAGDATVEVDDSRARDLALLRLGTHPIKDADESKPRGWDIPEEKDKEEEVVLVAHTMIPYRTLSETSESGDERCLLGSHDLSLLSSSFSSDSRSRSSSLSSVRDSSDYLGDISGEETPARRITFWPPSKKVKLNLEEDGSPFAVSPRIPGVPYYGVPTSNLAESPGRISRGLDAFFNSRSIVHRLGPHGSEQVYEMVACSERCGFAYPVPPKQEIVS